MIRIANIVIHDIGMSMGFRSHGSPILLNCGGASELGASALRAERFRDPACRFEENGKVVPLQLVE